MKTAVEKLNPTLAKIEVEVPFAEFKPYLDRTYKNLSGQISVPGFRKGKLPKQLIEQRAGFDYIVEASLNDALNDYYAQALGENELSPLAQPELDVQSQPSTENREADLKLTITVTVRPEIELPNYEGLEVEVDEVEVTAEDEVQALDALRERFGTLKTVERPAADKDFVTIDIAAEIDGEQVDAANDLSYQIGSGTMLDGIDEALTGLSAGEDATFETKLSGGERQRVRLALALAGNPDFLILDEPTAGMDALARRAFWETMRAEAAEGRTLLFATHYLTEARKDADRIVIIDAGKVLLDAPTEQVVADNEDLEDVFERITSHADAE